MRVFNLFLILSKIRSRG